MDPYGEQVRQVLEKLIGGSPGGRGGKWGPGQKQFRMKPYFNEAPLQERMMDRVRSELTACGWKEKVRLECNRIIKERGGITKISGPAELAEQVTTYARSQVPMELKRELVSMLREALLNELEGTNLKP